VAGCDGSTAPGAAGAPGQPREADLILAVSEEHVYLDPQKISWVSDGRIADCLYEPLVRYRVPELTIEPAAAEAWEVSADGRTWTFHLRQRARWSNGEPVTAGDFVYAWRRAMLPDTAADFAMLMFTIAGAQDFFHWRQSQLQQYANGPTHTPEAVRALWAEALRHFEDTVGLRALDDRTLEVRLSQPVPYFLELCAFSAFMPVHAKSVAAVTDLDPGTGLLRPDAAWFSDPQRLVSNGPYRLQRRRFKRDLLLVQNQHYWNKDAMGNRSILEKIVPDLQTLLIQYQRGQIDLLLDLPSATQVVADLVQQQRPDVHTQSMAGVYFYNFNCQPTRPDGSPNPLADPRVRRALSAAINRELLVKYVTQLDQPVARSFVPPDAVAGYAAPVADGIGFDLDLARRELAAAGYPGGKGLAGVSILYNTGFGHENIAQAIKRMWQEYLGVTATLEGVEVKSFSSRLKKHEFSACRASWFGDYRDPTTWLDKMATDNGNNDCGYSNPAYDALLVQAAQESDPRQRFDLLRQAEALMLRDAPMAMIYQYVQVYFWDPQRVENIATNPWGRWRLEQVSVE
jgi:oligopeptide transport system substrate-binding protein